MITREEAIQKLMTLWEVTEFIFLARFDIPKAQRDSDDQRAFGFFKEIDWNKKRLTFPDSENGSKRNFASCYAKKEGLNHNVYYIITAELSPDDKREKNHYGLALVNAREATVEEIDQHRATFEMKEAVFLAYVNFVAIDNSHAYVKIVDGLNTKSIKNANGEKGEVMYDFPEKIRKGQIILVKKTKRKQAVSFVSDIFKGTLCNGKTFLDLNTFSSPLGLCASNIIGFTNDGLGGYNSRIKCAVIIYDSSPDFWIERIESDEELDFSDVDDFVNKNIHELFNLDIEDVDFAYRIKFIEKVDADFKNKVSDIFKNDWEGIKSQSNEDLLAEFLERWTNKYPEIVLFSNVGDIELSSLFIKMWKANQLPIDFFENQLCNVFISYITSDRIIHQEFLIGLHPNRFTLLKTKFLELFETSFSVDSVQVYSLMDSIINEFPFTELQKKNAFHILQSAVTDEVQFELWKRNKSDNFPIDIAISNFKELDAQHQEHLVLRLSDGDIIPLLGQINIDGFVKKNMIELFTLPVSADEFTNRIKILEKVDAEFKNKVFDVFKNEWQIAESQSKEGLLVGFLQSWTKKYPEIVLLSNIGDSKHSAIFMRMWKENQLPIDFFEDQLFNCLISYIASEKITDKEFFQSLDSSLYALLKTKYLALLKTNISVDSVQVYLIMESFINEFFTKVQKKNAFQVLNSAISEEVQFELWKQNKLDTFPFDIARSNFKELDSQHQEILILQLSDDELIPLRGQIKPTESFEVNERIENLNERFILEKFGFVVFDIESDKNKVFEIAWSEGNIVNDYKNQDVETGISQFKEDSKNKVLVGHNIVDFDLPILSKIQDFKYDNNFVWDTLTVEKVLSPDLKTYALNTRHTAKEDVIHTLALFKNQFLRVLKLIEDKTQILEGILPIEVFSKIVSLSNDFKFHLSLKALNESKLAFFRPQPKTNPLISDLIVLLTNSKEQSKIILADESMTSDLLNYGKICFTNKFLDNVDFQVISAHKIKDSIHLDSSHKIQLIRYVYFCQKKETIPYWGNVSPSIRNEIEGTVDVWSLFEDSKLHNQNTTYPLFISADELESISLLSIETSNSELFILQPNLISITQKKLIKQIDIEQLKAVFQENYFWMKFSGGQSVVNISKNEVQILVTENLDSYDNFWIEKYQYGKYRIYANKNWENEISKLSFKHVSRIELDPEQFKTDQVISVKFKPNKNGEYNVTRFNPESIYRSRYWVIQKKIIDQLVSLGDSVLLVQRSEEIELLTNYFEADGYYIPQQEIGLGRRLELLHRNNKKDKIIIININEADRILKLNHSFPVNLIVDSFNLIDLYYCSFGTSFFNEKINEGTFKKDSDLRIASDEEESEDLDVEFSNYNDNFLKDNFFLLKLLRPKITTLRNLLFLNDPQNKMWFLDPRIDDHNELSKQWNITREFVLSWGDKEEFEKEVMKAESFIQSPKPQEIPFTEEETIEIIRNVFISGYEWKPEQLPHLKEILKSKKDWLINLPTGVGKSVLFQGPALLKSAFTNRLTIVITPLKALMEDHVNKLWELGFYGCVDYLNSDRSYDKDLIYRSIAGGEMSLLFVTPERFRSRGFLNAIDARIQNDGGLEYFVFDEAHCVSQWGHDFRPDYFNSAKQVWRTKTISNYPTPILLFSATVSEKIYQDFNTIFS